MRRITLTNRVTGQVVPNAILVVMNGPKDAPDRVPSWSASMLDAHSERVVKITVLLQTILTTQARGLSTFMHVGHGTWHRIEAELQPDDGIG